MFIVMGKTFTSFLIIVFLLKNARAPQSRYPLGK
jgi:hypothetical protein